jgi:transposase
MKQYCEYFKTCAIRYYENTKSITDSINAFDICRKTLYNWRTMYNNGLLNAPVKYKSYRSKYTSEIVNYVRKYVTNNQRFRMKNLLKLLTKNFDVHFNSNNVYYILRKNGITYKKAHNVIIINMKKHKNDVKNIKQEIRDIGYDNI